MTAALIVLLPVALLVLVSGFCFVGCVLDTHGTGADNPPPQTFTKYSGTVTGNVNCIAYWPLDEAAPANDSGKITAHDAMGSNDGEYKHKGNAPGLFPSLAFAESPTAHSALGTGFMSLGTQSLLPGDAKQPANDPNVLTTGMQTDGAFVAVPFNAKLNIGIFSLEAWVRPEWDPAVPAFRTVVDSRDNAGGKINGFLLVAGEDGAWRANLSDVNGAFTVASAGTPTPSKIAHLVLTFDGTTATLYVDGVAGTPVQMPAAYSPNTTTRLAIGAGGPWLPDRQNSMGGQGFFPCYPFNGTIQSVALYNIVLAPDDIKKHFDDGSGNTKVPAG